ncbi:TlpA disulfide reductase family protein [Lutibacter citreus]|uniref:TlpA disulfide reductase family protein n=1 Tax=Lutibacter citreus TaxID=2138210 RepID=UPI000DBE5CC4|nr:TlpA disulfide reductase family protein [Lutibacter citreus]
MKNFEMKRIYNLLVLFTLILFSCNFTQDKKSNSNTANSLKLTGTIENLKGSLTVVLTKMDSRNFYGKSIDSTLSLNGSFELKIEINEPSEYMIIDYKNKVAKRNYLWLENGDISITGNFDDFENAKISGSKLTELSEKYFKIVEKYNSQMKKGEIEYKDFQKGMFKERLDFLFQHPNNIVSLTNLLGFTNNVSKDSLQLFYSKLDDELQNSKNGIALKNSFEIQKIKEGEQFIDINAKDLEGNIVKISDFKGKVIVLDFWAIWCHYCHEQNKEEFPKLKEKYKDKDFVIISYSVDVDKKDWEKSTKSDNIDWINIPNLQGVSDKVVTQYGVQGYPTSFIIGKDGKILKKIKGYQYNALETELDKIFNLK